MKIVKKQLIGFMKNTQKILSRDYIEQFGIQVNFLEKFLEQIII